MIAESNDNIYNKLLEITTEFLGPASERFILRKIKTHLHKDPNDLTPDDINKLIEWIKVAIAMLTEDDEMVAQFTKRLIDLAQDSRKAEFISLATHQLQAPLGALKWNLEIFLDGTYGDTNKEQKSALNLLHELAVHMSETVNSLLNVSRIELGTYPIEPVPTSYVEIAKNVILELKEQIEKKKLQVIENYDTNIPNIPSDKSLARIIVENVITNAVKYTPQKGTVSIYIHNNPKNKPVGILIAVTDTGVGIPKGQQKMVFSKMFRARNTQKIEGTGLGLYLLKRVVEIAKGTVWFESKEKKGTTFFIELPYKGMSRATGT